jgi:hypothetical protein
MEVIRVGSEQHVLVDSCVTPHRNTVSPHEDRLVNVDPHNRFLQSSERASAFEIQ